MLVALGEKRLTRCPHLHGQDSLKPFPITAALMVSVAREKSVWNAELDQLNAHTQKSVRLISCVFWLDAQPFFFFF